MTIAATIMWIVALLLGAVVLVVVTALLQAVARPIGESRRYALEIEQAIQGARDNLDGLGQMRETQELLAAVHMAFRARGRGAGS